MHRQICDLFPHKRARAFCAESTQGELANWRITHGTLVVTARWCDPLVWTLIKVRHL